MIGIGEYNWLICYDRDEILWDSILIDLHEDFA